MIERFVKRYFENKEKLKNELRKSHPENYKSLVQAVIQFGLRSEDNYEECGWPDFKRITEIDHGHYQGTLIYIIAENGYQPSEYWAVKVDYGSCSGCDTLEGIKNYDDNAPTEEQLNQYMTLTLHIIQGLKEI